jgi:hypothetical protein
MTVIPAEWTDHKKFLLDAAIPTEQAAGSYYGINQADSVLSQYYPTTNTSTWAYLETIASISGSAGRAILRLGVQTYDTSRTPTSVKLRMYFYNQVNGITEDLTTFTKAGANAACMTVTAAKNLMTDMQYGYAAYNSLDKGANYFAGNFTHFFEANISALDSGAMIGLWAVTNTVGTEFGWQVFSCYTLFVHASKSGGTLQLQLVECNNGSLTHTATYSGANLTIGATIYYCRVDRVGTAATLKIFSTAALRLANGTPDIGTATIATLTAATSYQFLEAGFSEQYSGTQKGTGYIQNVNIHPSSQGRTIDCYELDASKKGNSWTEAGVTWAHAVQDTVEWTTAGDGAWSDIIAATKSQCVVPGPYGWMEWTLPAATVTRLLATGVVNLLLCDSVEIATEVHASLWYSKEEATQTTLRPQLQINYAAQTPAVPSNYKVAVDVYRGSPSVEDGSWTVNGYTMRHRIAFPITVHDALDGTYVQDIKIDTKALVSGAFFGGSAAAYASTVEFADITGANPMKYWVTSQYGTIIKFNTTATPYFVRLPACSADTTYTFYMYFDPLRSSGTLSSNFSGADTASFFEDFVTTKTNLADFLAYYSKWENDLGTPVVSVAGGSLSLTGISH